MSVMENQIISVGIIEDQILFREGIKAILHSSGEFEVIFESGDGYSVIERLKQSRLLPDVLLVDLSLPPNGKLEYSGLQLTRDIVATFPQIKILVLSIHNDDNFITELVRNGAHGYLVKDCDPAEVFEAVRSVYQKGSYINARALKAIQGSMTTKNRPRRLSIQLSGREIEILQMVCQQFTAEEIAKRLFISVKTVNGHRNNLLLKTGSKNVTGLVIYAVKNDIVKVF
jgi:DNA-binding NarL/FixJ family response regulator